MEFPNSDPDSDSYERDSDEFDEDIENELYSIVHYNVISEDIPSDILNKYDIKRTEQNEILISLKKTNPKSLEETKTVAEETVIVEENVNSQQNYITISDDDSDSDVILNEPQLDVTYVSSPSVVEVDSLSDSDMGDDVILNIGNTTSLSSVFPADDSEEEEEAVKVKWKEVVSPSSWTKEMRKYYNKPCERLKNFDYEKIREEMKGKGDWSINLADRLQSKRKVKRCTICRQTDHQRKNCPRRFVNCHMCGGPGHNESSCPSKKCLNCGRKNNVYVAMCQQCEDARYQTCSECQQKGHTKDLCPDSWRRYHATTKGELVVKEVTLNKRLMCCNCAQSGHLFENCPKLYWSVYPPTTCLIKKTVEPVIKSPKGKRFSEEDTVDFVRTPKKPRRNQRYYDEPSNGPKWNRGHMNRNSTQFHGQTPFDRSHTPFNRNPSSSNQNPPFVRNPSFNRNPTPTNERSTPFHQRSTPFNKRFTQFNQTSTPLNQTSTPFYQNASFNNKRFNQFNSNSTPFNQTPTPFNNRSTQYNEPSTSFQHSKPQTPKRKKKNRYFQNNSFNNCVNMTNHSPKQTKNPKQKKKKKKAKNSLQ